MWQLSSGINKVGRRQWQKSATVTEKEGDHCPRPWVPMHCAPNSVDPACVINKNSAESCWLHDQSCMVGSNQFAKFLLPRFTQRQVRGRPVGLLSNNIQFREIQNDDVVGDTISTVGLAVCDRHYFYTIPCVINVQTDRLTAVSISRTTKTDDSTEYRCECTGQHIVSSLICDRSTSGDCYWPDTDIVRLLQCNISGQTCRRCTVYKVNRAFSDNMEPQRPADPLWLLTDASTDVKHYGRPLRSNCGTRKGAWSRMLLEAEVIFFYFTIKYELAILTL